MDIIVGTAGHIDHGKTALVKALTGVDADRLPEEKQRGITIDLGFAEMDLGELRVGFIDVPGHERFVKNMLAGAGGIDLVLLVIAADEGVMPQTREHFEICRLLDIRHGLIVLTKADLADEEMLELVRMDAAELVEGSFLEGAEMVPVSAKDGTGLIQLKSQLVKSSALVPGRDPRAAARLSVDRTFSVKGFGAVVTGTVTGGQISEGDEMEILPPGRAVRVRGLQTHSKPVKEVRTGMRAAANLGGIDHDEIERGMTLAAKGVLRPTQIIDAEVEVLAGAKPIKSRQRIRLHIGAAEVLARVSVLNERAELAAGETGSLQVRTEAPIVAAAGDRFVIRSYSPQATIAGGQVLHPFPERHRRRDAEAAAEFLAKLRAAASDAEKARLYVENAGIAGLTLRDVQAITGWRAEPAAAAIEENVKAKAVADADGLYVASAEFEKIKEKALGEIAQHHKRETLSRGMPRETLRERVFRYVRPEIFRAATAELESAGKIVSEQDVFKAAEHRAELSPKETAAAERMREMYNAAGVQPPKTDEVIAEAARAAGISAADAKKVFQHLVNGREIVKVTDDLFFAATVIAGLAERLREYAASTPDRLIDVGKFKDLAGVSRKFAIPLLEYFDREKVTIRAGEKRVIRQ